jgi:hypothetical protein
MNTEHAWILVWASGHIINVSAIDIYQKNGTGSRTVAVRSSFGMPWKSQP